MNSNRIPSRLAGIVIAVLTTMLAAHTLAQTLWTNVTGDYNVATAWTPNTVPTGNVNAVNDNGSNNIVLIQDGDPVWVHGDTRAGSSNNASGAYLQTGSTNFTGQSAFTSWLRLGVGTNSLGYYTLSNGFCQVAGNVEIGEQGVGYLKVAGGVLSQTNAAGRFTLGDAPNFGTISNYPVGTMEIDGGTVTAGANVLVIGDGANVSSRVGTGNLIMNGGFLNHSGSGNFVVSRQGGIANLIMHGGVINQTNPAGLLRFAVAATTAGTNVSVANLTMTGGTINCAGEMDFATDNTGAANGGFACATNNMSGGAFNVGGWFAIGRNGSLGVWNMTGGAVTKLNTVAGTHITVGCVFNALSPSVAIINQSGGTFTNTGAQTWIAENSQATWNLSGTGACVFGLVNLSRAAGAVGVFNLNGGDLTATDISGPGGNGTLNFNGGTLHAGASTTSFLHDLGASGSAVVQAGGANINTEGYNVTIAQPLVDGGGGLTKLGLGALTLTGANSYSGATTVSAGTLNTTTASFAGGAVTVADNAGFGVTLAAANGQITASGLTLGTSGATAVSFDLGNFGNPLVGAINVAGNLAVNGTVTISVADALPQLGQFPLLQYGTQSGSGSLVLGALPTGVAGYISNNIASSSIDLVITGVAVNRWEGLAGGNWDINVTTNWVNFATLAPAFFVDGRPVIFNDAALGTTTVNLVTNVQPASVVVANDTLNYTFTGSGKIGGGSGLTKAGAATLTLANTNNYTGATTLSGGAVIVTSLANGGVASPMGAATASASNLVFNGGTLVYSGPATTINRGYTVQAPYVTNQAPIQDSLTVNSNLTLTGAVTAGSLGTFIKGGEATLSYVGAVTNQLSAGNQSPSYGVAAGTVRFDGSGGNQSNIVTGEMWVGNTTNGGGNLVLTNSSLRITSWLALARGTGNNNFTSSATLYNSTLAVGNLTLGYSPAAIVSTAGNSETASMTLNNSTITNGGADCPIGETTGSSATLTLNGASVFNLVGPFLPGRSIGATGTVVVANSSAINVSRWLSLGANGVGYLTIKDNGRFSTTSDFNLGDYGGAFSAGYLTLQDQALVTQTGGSGVFIGKTAGAIGVVTQTGGTVDAHTAGAFQLAQQAGSTGTWLQSGGTNYAGGWVSIGRGATVGDTSPTGFLLVAGGLFDQNSPGNGLIVGEQGTGTLTITNTGLVVSEATNIGVAIGWNQGMGSVNLQAGGTLTANFVQSGLANGSPAANATFNFDGGVLKAGVNAQTNFVRNLENAYVLAGAVIDTAGQTIAINSALLDGGTGGGLTKNGNGTLLLNGTNTYTGTTTINAGNLGGNGLIAGALVVNSGAGLAPGGSLGVLTVGGNLTLNAGSTNVFEVDGSTPANDLVVAGANVAYGGVLKIIPSGSFIVGQQFQLFSGTGAVNTSQFASVQSSSPTAGFTFTNGMLTVVSTGPDLAQNRLTNSITGGGATLSLSWSPGWKLQAQTNTLATGLGNNWVYLTDGTVTSTNVAMVPNNPAVFYRLVNQ